VVENLLQAIKTELVYHRAYRTQAEALADLFHYIERFYNPRRRHSSSATAPPLYRRNAVQPVPEHTWLLAVDLPRCCAIIEGETLRDEADNVRCGASAGRRRSAYVNQQENEADER